MTPSRSPAKIALGLCVALVAASAGCRADTRDWIVVLEGQVVDGPITVGAGLTTRVAVTIEVEGGVLDFLVKPDNLLVLAPAGIETAEAGTACFRANRPEEPAACDDAPTAGVGTLLDVRTDRTGTSRFELLADNIDEKWTVELDGREVTRVDYAIAGDEVILDDPQAGTITIGQIFVGTELQIDTRFFAAPRLGGGDVRLPGTAPLELISPAEAASGLSGSVLALGPEPAVYELRTAVLPDLLRVYGRTLDHITSIQLTAPAQVRANAAFWLEATPIDGGHRPIAGTPPEPFTVEVVGGTEDDFFRRDYSARITAGEPGVATLRVTWGGATAEVDVEVVE